jgi:hypothetical protein
MADPEGQNVVYSMAAPPVAVFYMHLVNKQHPWRCLERVGCEPLQRIEFPTLPNQCNHGANGVRIEVAVQSLHCLTVIKNLACQGSVCLGESSIIPRFSSYLRQAIEQTHTQDVCDLITQLVEDVSSENQLRPLTCLFE